MYWQNFMIWKKKSKFLITINKSLNNVYKTMFPFCLKCSKNTEKKNPKIVRGQKTED